MHHALGVRLQLVLHDRSVLEPKMLEKLTAREVTVSGLDVVERSDVAWMDRFNHLVAESLVHFVIRALRAAIFLPLMRSRGVRRVDWCWSRLDWWNKWDVSSRQVVVDCRCHRESEVTKDAAPPSDGTDITLPLSWVCTIVMVAYVSLEVLVEMGVNVLIGKESAILEMEAVMVEATAGVGESNK